MSLNNAMRFIRESQGDPGLRKKMNQCTPQEVFPRLTELGYEFTMDEFDESVNLMHVKCQFQEDGERLMQTKIWFEMLVS